MNIRDAKTLALDLMYQHGLLTIKLPQHPWNRPWRLEFNNTGRQAGCTNYGSRTITLSKMNIELSSSKVVRNTILHEIAHVLVGPGHRHDRTWKKKAVEIGASPVHYCEGFTKFSFRLDCPECGRKSDLYFYRHPHRIARYRCPDCHKIRHKEVTPVATKGEFIVDVSTMQEIAGGHKVPSDESSGVSNPARF
jgi:predicted SprT family Zn-dependent metalloprotease